MSQRSDPKSLSGWILVAGFLLVSFGLVARGGQDEDNGGVPGADAFRYTQAYGTADSNGSMIAVTGVDVTGGSLLFLVDTESRQLSVYQATGGTKSTMNVRWVGARNIDLDLQVDGFNDESEYTFKQLASEFAETGSLEEPNR